MADSLDDFFAKKDKKRGKNKPASTLCAEVLVRELEEGAKQVEIPSRKDKTSAAIEILGLDANDSNWRDFDEVDKRDYTGLKVKEMSLQDQVEVEQRRPSADQIDGATDISAWKVKDEQQPTDSDQSKNPESKSDIDQSVSGAAPKSDQASTTEPTPQNGREEAKKTGDKPSAKYRVPALRNSEIQELKPTVLGKSRGIGSRNNDKVNIQDTEMFPSLG